MKTEDNHLGPLSVCAEAASPRPPGVRLSPFIVQVLAVEVWVKSWKQTCRFEAQLQFLHLQRAERRQPEQTLSRSCSLAHARASEPSSMVQNNVGGTSMLAVFNLSMTKLLVQQTLARHSIQRRVQTHIQKSFESSAGGLDLSSRAPAHRPAGPPARLLCSLLPTSMSASPFGCSPASLLAQTSEATRDTPVCGRFIRSDRHHLPQAGSASSLPSRTARVALYCSPWHMLVM